MLSSWWLEHIWGASPPAPLGLYRAITQTNCAYWYCPWHSVIHQESPSEPRQY